MGEIDNSAMMVMRTESGFVVINGWVGYGLGSSTGRILGGFSTIEEAFVFIKSKLISEKEGSNVKS